MVTLDQVLLQFETKLILCQTYPVLQEYLYQLCLINFQCLNVFKLTEPLPLKRLLELGLQHPSCKKRAESLDKEALVNQMLARLTQQAPMLADFFSI